MKDLHIGHGFRLPLEAATQTLLIVGKRGSGKSSTATRFAEQLIDARTPIVVLDPVDVWWGLKAGADGSREGGKEIYIFGGRHADLPLEPTLSAGELLADVFVDERINMVICLRGLTEGEKAKVATGFADRLFKRNQEVVHIFCEEAHRFMPQTRRERGVEENTMLSRVLRLWTEGRSSGIGLTAITQRVATLHKDATTQAEILVAHRLIGPQDIKAVDGWIEHHHQQGLRGQVLSTLPELKTGETWVWAPDFPEDMPIGLKSVQILAPVTFDSRRTPKPGEKLTEPKQLAAVDLERLGEKMKATRERAQQTDPKHLQRQLQERDRAILQLRAELARKPQVSMADPIRIETKVPIVKDQQLRRFERAGAQFEAAAARLSEAVPAVGEAVREFRAGLADVRSLLANGDRARSSVAGPAAPAPGKRTVAHRGPVLPAPRPPAMPAQEGTLSRQSLAMLQELARRHPVRLTRAQLATLSGYSTKSSQFGPAIRDLLAAGMLEEVSGELAVTEAGLATAAVDVAMPTSPEETVAMWLQKLPVQAAAFLRELWKARPRGMSLEHLAEATGYRMTSSQFRPSLNTLVRNGLVELEDDRARVSDTLLGVPA